MIISTSGSGWTSLPLLEREHFTGFPGVQNRGPARVLGYAVLAEELRWNARKASVLDQLEYDCRIYIPAVLDQNSGKPQSALPW
jgi:hypothetical protein